MQGVDQCIVAAAKSFGDVIDTETTNMFANIIDKDIAKIDTTLDSELLKILNEFNIEFRVFSFFPWDTYFHIDFLWYSNLQFTDSKY